MESIDKKPPHPLEVHAQNREWFEDPINRKRESTKHPDKWVAIEDRRVIDSDARHIDLHTRVIALVGRHAQFVTIISTIGSKT